MACMSHCYRHFIPTCNGVLVSFGDDNIDYRREAIWHPFRMASPVLWRYVYSSIHTIFNYYDIIFWFLQTDNDRDLLDPLIELDKAVTWSIYRYEIGFTFRRFCTMVGLHAQYSTYEQRMQLGAEFVSLSSYPLGCMEPMHWIQCFCHFSFSSLTNCGISCFSVMQKGSRMKIILLCANPIVTKIILFATRSSSCDWALLLMVTIEAARNIFWFLLWLDPSSCTVLIEMIQCTAVSSFINFCWGFYLPSSSALLSYWCCGSWNIFLIDTQNDIGELLRKRGCALRVLVLVVLLLLGTIIQRLHEFNSFMICLFTKVIRYWCVLCVCYVTSFHYCQVLWRFIVILMYIQSCLPQVHPAGQPISVLSRLYLIDNYDHQQKQIWLQIKLFVLSLCLFDCKIMDLVWLFVSSCTAAKASSFMYLLQSCWCTCLNTK